MRTVLITGANRGIGFEHARQYAKDGWRVIACCRQPNAAPELESLRHAFRNQVQVLALDVSNRAAIDAMATSLAGDSIDLLINNAGSYGPQGIPDGIAYQRLGSIDYSIWEDILRINVLGAMKMTEAFLPQVERSSRKLVVMMSSDLGSVTNNIKPGQSYCYRSSKAALNMVTKGLSLDLKARGVTVVAMAPGWVRTDMGGKGIADLEPHDSVAAQRKVFEALTVADTGRFLNYRGEDVAW